MASPISLLRNQPTTTPTLGWALGGTALVIRECALCVSWLKESSLSRQKTVTDFYFPCSNAKVKYTPTYTSSYLSIDPSHHHQAVASKLTLNQLNYPLQGPYAPQGSTSLLPKLSVTSKVSAPTSSAWVGSRVQNRSSEDVTLLEFTSPVGP